MVAQNFDIILVGGGLQNGLVALALAHHQPALRVALVERGAELGGNHVWCFHAGDVPIEALPFVEPLVVRRWPAYSVHFPNGSRRLDESYAATTSQQLHTTLLKLAERTPSFRPFLRASAARVDAGRVVLASGQELTARLVIDARGPSQFSLDGVGGYQKFVGLELEVAPPGVPDLPVLMDARVEQRDGFRFFYVLPLSERRVLVEDTYFSNSPALDCAALRDGILAHARNIGLRVQALCREERGVLPLPTRRVRAHAASPGLIVAGYQGGWFHPTTGYSFPLAVRFAREVAREDIAEAAARVECAARTRVRQQRYATLLNRLLFEGFEPSERFHVFERFYRLPSATLGRFYALELTAFDRARILCGRPPTGFRGQRLFARRSERQPPSPLGENA